MGHPGSVHQASHVAAHEVPSLRLAQRDAEDFQHKNRGVEPRSAIVICRPYQQRRAYATFPAGWPELDVLCTSRQLSLPDYVATIGDASFVVDMVVGDTQRVIEYPTAGFSMDQAVPDPVVRAYQRLVKAGFTSRCIKPSTGRRPSYQERSSTSTPDLGQ